MAEASPGQLSFLCPQCQRKLRAPANLAGQKLNCPKCSAAIRVPGATPAKKTDDEWLSLDEPITSLDTEPASPGKTSKPIPSSAPIASAPSIPNSFNGPVKKSPFTATPSTATESTAKSRSIFDDDLPDLAPLQQTDAAPSAKALPPDMDLSPLQTADLNLPDLKLESPALSPDFSIPTAQEFRFPCRVCGTLLFTQKERAGQMIRCPDCYSELLVPLPKNKTKPKEIKIEDAASVTLAPIEAKNSKVHSPEANTKEIMEKAAVQADQEREEYDSVNAVFDTKRWLGLLFGFMRDPLVVLAIVGLGLAMGLWFGAIMAMGTWFNLEVAQAAIARIALFAVFFIPLSVATCMCGLAILTMAANRAPRVNEWPFSRLGEAWGECLYALASIAIASVPGGMIGSVLAALNAHPLIGVAALLIGMWGISPIALMSMIQNGSIMQPYSKRINDSILTFQDAWGAMYMQSGLAYVGIFGVLLMSYFRGPIGCGLLGFFIPFLVFFIFNQIGVLAGRISAAMDLGFDGDFSDD